MVDVCGLGLAALGDKILRIIVLPSETVPGHPSIILYLTLSDSIPLLALDELNIHLLSPCHPAFFHIFPGSTMIHLGRTATTSFSETM
jgi:hypothetical protein